MELLMIYKISPHPSLLKRGREKAEMTHSIPRRPFIKESLNLGHKKFSWFVPAVGRD
jgi:hypothetical protein